MLTPSWSAICLGVKFFLCKRLTSMCCFLSPQGLSFLYDLLCCRFAGKLGQDDRLIFFLFLSLMRNVIENFLFTVSVGDCL